LSTLSLFSSQQPAVQFHIMGTSDTPPYNWWPPIKQATILFTSKNNDNRDKKMRWGSIFGPRSLQT
jgi:hypothetical protein